MEGCQACGHWHQTNPCRVQELIRHDGRVPVVTEPCQCSAVVMNATCPGCGKPVRLEKSPTCWECWYAGQMQEAEERFRPLTKELSKRLEYVPEVEQTGGMVMCLAIRFSDTAWCWISELDEYDSPLLGLYRHEEDEGEYPEPTPDVRSDSPPEVIAEWMVPHILRFAASLEGVTR
jgi:hypothetical protein